MTNLMLNSFLVLLTIFFGAMALYPLFISSTDAELDMEFGGEDRVICVVPLDLDRDAPTPLVPRSGDEHPGHQPAA
ncbi:MAG: hypothetical protein M9934_14515 [Thermomicrobiales bacterium]|nr:hypothetical protein [Thermomicrobiales bacterium]